MGVETTAKPARPRFFYGYVVAGAALIVCAVTYGSQLTFGVFFKALSEEFGWSRAMTSAAYSLNLSLHGLMGIAAGRLTDRFGPRLIVLVFGSILGIGYLLMSQTQAIWQFYLYFGVVIAAGISTGLVPTMSTVVRWFARRRGLITAIASSGINLGQVIMSPIAGWLILTRGWRDSYFIFGWGILLVIFISAFFLKRDPSDIGQRPYGADEAEKSKTPRPTVRAARGLSLSHMALSPHFWLVWLTFFCFGFSRSFITVHIAPLVTDIGFSLTFAAGILSVVGLLAIVGRLLLGMAADRIGNGQAMLLGFGLMAVSTFWLLAAQEVWALYLFAALFGLSWGGLASVRVPLTAEVFGLGSLGAALGVVEFGTALGGAAGPLVGGWLFDLRGSYQMALMVSGAVSLLAVLLMFFVMRIKPAISGE